MQEFTLLRQVYYQIIIPEIVITQKSYLTKQIREGSRLNMKQRRKIIVTKSPTQTVNFVTKDNIKLKCPFVR